MSTLPDLTTTTSVIEDALAEIGKAGDRVSRRMGASAIGDPCDRSLWFSFRWASLGLDVPSPRLRRLFSDGDWWEKQAAAELRLIPGLQLHVNDPANPEKQIGFTAVGGHFVAYTDGMTLGLPEAPKSWHAWECKSMNDKWFKQFIKKGLEKTYPKHHAQLQVAIELSGVDRGLYTAKNKNDSTRIDLRVKKDGTGKQMIERAERIITSDVRPNRVSDDPSWYECKFCKHHSTCHSNRVPDATCRTCAHSTPVVAEGGNGEWHCNKHNCELTHEAQQQACQAHLFNPEFIANWAKPIDSDHSSVTYEIPATGNQFINAPHEYSSFEMAQAGDPLAIGNEIVDALRSDFDGEIVA